MASGVELAPGLEVVPGLPLLYYRGGNALILSDVHLGFEDAMASTGVFLPRIQLSRAVDSIAKALEATGARRVFINGDLKHVFEKLTRQERIEIPRFVEALSSHGVSEVILVRGNHDTFLSGLLQKLGVQIVEDYLDLGRIILTHGHKLVEAEAEVIVIGHEHPVLQVSVGGSKVKFPIVLKMPSETGEEIIVLPALGVYQSGNPVTLERSQYLSEIVKRKGLVADATPIVVDKSVGSMILPPLGRFLPSL